MADYIEREAALAAIRERCAPCGEGIEALKSVPAADVVPVVRGEWIQKHHIISLDNMTLTGTYPTCSLCGYAWLGVAKNTNYCPNCGAKMDGDE